MSGHLRAAAYLFLSALAAAAQSPAQDWSAVKALAAGTSVRVSSGSHTINGQVQSVTDESLSIDSGKKQQTLDRQEVLRVSVKKTAHRVRNTLI